MSTVENIKSLCETQGISIPKLEKLLGLSKGSIYNWDKNSPSIDKVQKISDYFNVSINRVLYGFDANKFSNLTNIAKGNRTLVQFSTDTGLDQNEIVRICLGYPYDKPSVETVHKIASNNQHSILFGEDDFLEAAGYVSERQLDSTRKRATEELVDYYEKAGFTVTPENEDIVDKVHINNKNGGIVTTLSLHEFLEKGFDLLNNLTNNYEEEIYTIAAHHDGEGWTEDELQDIEEFKELLKLKRQLKKNRE
ncbi:helix-turn-helix transcriptional regulator [Paenibacillus sp. BR2-3]|uniref:helix-turn-helix domain-containing protein n=1 Tax=Paenibacillus sp. BR2-3 TaxID=3048494 RepID=UPI003977C26E